MAVIDRTAGRAALRDLHRARSQRFLLDVDWVDSLYKAYITAIVAAFAVFFGSRLFGTDHLTAAELADVRRYGPALLGLVVALGLAAGLRSGSRGGPLALEPADVTHVLLAPVPRATVMRRAASSQARGVLLVGAVLGAIAGNLAAFRLPGDRAAWIVCGVAFGALAVLASWAAALVASGNRIGTRVATAIGFVLIAWSALDVATHGHSSFGSALARIALLPITSDAAAVVAGVAAATAVVVLTIFGLRTIGGASVEAAERRARLVGELRFAATIQDLRTVIVLHRQLALQLPRSRPWFRVAGRAGSTARVGELHACWTRDWQGIARWPGNRLLRQAALGLVAGGALAAVWNGTPALVIVAGIALFLAGLDATEGLAEETDHPLRAAGYPVRWGRLLVSHLLAPAALVLLGELVGFAVVAVFSTSSLSLEVTALVLIPAALAATVGAAAAVVLGTPSANLLTLGSQMGFPEISMLLVLLRQTFPPALAIVAVAPIAIAQGATTDALAAGAAALIVPLLAFVGVTVWIHSRKLRFE